MQKNTLRKEAIGYRYITAAHRHLKGLTSQKKNAIIFYHSDTDGLMSAWLFCKILEHLGVINIRTLPVWSHQFTFKFLDDFEVDNVREFVIFTDLPLLQEPDTLSRFSRNNSCYVYDHHRPPENSKQDIEGVLYHNSLLFTKQSWPASYFTYLLHSKIVAETPLSILLATLGLIGDNALDRFPEMRIEISKLFPGILDSALIWDSQAGKLCSSFNVIFKANPLGLPYDLRLFVPSDSDPPLEELLNTVSALKVDELSKSVQIEVEHLYNDLLKRCEKSGEGSAIISLTNMKTFSVGIVAAKLIASKIIPFVCLGFQLGNLIQYELRTADNSVASVLDILDQLSLEYKPISCGGHKVAGGLLINADDYNQVEAAIRSIYKKFMVNHDGKCK